MPGVERGVDRGDALRLVGRAVHAGHAHAAEAERGDGGAGGAERAGDHGSPPLGLDGVGLNQYQPRSQSRPGVAEHTSMRPSPARELPPVSFVVLEPTGPDSADGSPAARAARGRRLQLLRRRRRAACRAGRVSPARRALGSGHRRPARCPTARRRSSGRGEPRSLRRRGRGSGPARRRARHAAEHALTAPYSWTLAVALKLRAGRGSWLRRLDRPRRATRCSPRTRLRPRAQASSAGTRRHAPLVLDDGLRRRRRAQAGTGERPRPRRCRRRRAAGDVRAAWNLPARRPSCCCTSPTPAAATASACSRPRARARRRPAPGAGRRRCADEPGLARRAPLPPPRSIRASPSSPGVAGADRRRSWPERSLVLLPASAETTPLVLLEAMSHRVRGSPRPATGRPTSSLGEVVTRSNDPDVIDALLATTRRTSGSPTRAATTTRPATRGP